MENKITKKLRLYGLIAAIAMYPLIRLYDSSINSHNTLFQVITGISIGLFFMCVGIYIGYSNGSLKSKNGELPKNLKFDFGLLNHFIIFVVLNTLFGVKNILLDHKSSITNLLIIISWGVVLVIHYFYTKFISTSQIFE